MHRLVLLRILTRTRLERAPVSYDHESSGGLTAPLGPYSLMAHLTVLVPASIVFVHSLCANVEGI